LVLSPYYTPLFCVSVLMWCRRRQRAPHGVGERCTSTPHDQHENAQRGHAQQGHTQQVHAPRAWETQARITQVCTASAYTAGTRNASMGDASATTQACTEPAQSTGRSTPGMSTTWTSSCRTTVRAGIKRRRAAAGVYYWRTWYKAVCGGKGGSEGHVLRDTTSRGLRGRV